MANQCNFAKFAKIFYHQNFALYGILLAVHICTTGLPTNFTLANLVEVVTLQEQATQSDDMKCGSCLKASDSAAVIAFCYNCKEFLCPDCTRSHKNMKTLQHHNCVSIEELKSFKLSGSIEKPEFCKEHLEKKVNYSSC